MRATKRYATGSVLCGLLIASAALINLRAEVAPRSDTPIRTPFLALAVPSFPASAVIADLDGDGLADFTAVDKKLLGGRTHLYRVAVHLSSHSDSAIDLKSQAFGLHIVLLDIDRDHDLDFVLTTPFGQEPIGIWINDGHGAFSQGNPAFYPKFIWQPSDHFFELPAQPPEGTIAFVCPSGRSVIEPAELALPVPLNSHRTWRVLTCETRLIVTLSILLRAPPLL
jgi:hypothetical protein